VLVSWSPRSLLLVVSFAFKWFFQCKAFCRFAVAERVSYAHRRQFQITLWMVASA
jgi:hypothetical protein